MSAPRPTPAQVREAADRLGIRLLPWQQQVVDRAFGDQGDTEERLVVTRGRKMGWTTLQTVVDEAQRIAAAEQTPKPPAPKPPTPAAGKLAMNLAFAWLWRAQERLGFLAGSSRAPGLFKPEAREAAQREAQACMAASEARRAGR